MSGLIKLENVSIGFNNVPIIGGINLSVSSGDSWGIIGPNGGGKTTLLKTLIGFIKPVKGTCSALSSIRFGYVPQKEEFDSIFPLSVREFIAMGRYSRVPFGKMITRQDWKKIDEAIDRTGVSHLKKNIFSSLSGGESRRVLIARAIAGEPDVLVLDEPTASTDGKGQHQIMDLIEDIKKKSNLTVIMVNHHTESIKNLAHKFLFVNKDENLVRQYSRDDLLKGSTFEDLMHDQSDHGAIRT